MPPCIPQEFLYAASGNGITAFPFNSSTGVLGTSFQAASASTATNPLANMVPDPAGKFLFACASGNPSTEAFSINSKGGVLTPISGSTFPLQGIPGCTLSMHPTGKFLYTATSTGVSAFMRQWQMRLERAEYEAALAERRYQEVDPSNRLVAGTLERRWNDALLQLEDLKKQAAELQQQKARVATPEQKEKVMALARDLPRLWHAPTTQTKDRKRMLRLLIKDITVKESAVPKQLVVHIRWQGGACTDRSVQLPPKVADRVRYPAAVVQRVHELAQSLPDAQIAAHLNREGHSSAKDRPYTAKIIQWIRWRNQIPPATLKKPEEFTVQQVAQQFGVSTGVIYYWIEHEIITARRLNDGMPYWITLEPLDEHKLRDWVRNSSRIPKIS
jgi:Lactonase, 7-bladed beta-propeller